MGREIFMAILQNNDRYASSDRVDKSIAAVSKVYDLSYLLNRYVDQKYWVCELQTCFSVEYFDNLTDFNYARCFTYAINEGGVKLSVRDSDFKEFVASRGELNRLHVLVSTLAPYVVYKFVRYDYKDGNLRMEVLETGAGEWYKQMEVAIFEFCRRNDLLFIADNKLKEPIKGMSLELHGEEPSVFNFLFEDGAAGFPY